MLSTRTPTPTPNPKTSKTPAPGSTVRPSPTATPLRPQQIFPKSYDGLSPANAISPPQP
jgi:hypothetical protein